jgi:hypothetical protein
LTALPSLAASRVEGDRRKRDALALLEARRGVYVRRGRRALLLQLLATGSATADDVRLVVELPADIGPKLFGAVPTPLVEAGIIRHAGYTPTRRREGHARPVAVWELADRAAAVAWLAAHPDVQEPTDGKPEQLTLFDPPLNQGTRR